MVANPRVVRHLAVSQALYVGGSTVDLTLTGIVGASIAPTPGLATLPFSALFVAAGAEDVRTRKDLADRDRGVGGAKKPLGNPFPNR